MYSPGEPLPHAATSGSTEPSVAELRDTMQALIGMMVSGGISELDLSFGGVSIRLRGNGLAAAGTAMTVADASRLVPLDLPQTDGQPPVSSDAGHIITAPMIGTFYASPSPSEPPFVRLGDAVEVGQVIGIIEAMKIMNEIAADHAGVVADVLVDNGQAVEYGSPLLRLTSGRETLG